MKAIGLTATGLLITLTGVLGLVLFLATAIVKPPETTDMAAPETVCVPDTSEGPSKVKIPDEYKQLVQEAANESGFSPDLIAAQIQAESDWNPKTTSPVGAQGIAQFMPGTWKMYGNGGDPCNPNDAIPAQGRYMKALRETVEPHSDSTETTVRLTLASYNAGPGAVKKFDWNLDKMFASGYAETKNYVKKITDAASGSYTSECKSETDTQAGGNGDTVKTAATLAWDKRVQLPRSEAPLHGKEASKIEYVAATDKLYKTKNTAFYTDCGVFVSTVMRTSGVDKDFPARGTSGVMIPYLRDSSKYEAIHPSSEKDLKPGDIMIRPGHIYMYTGKRHNGSDGSAQGASLYTRPPSGHYMMLDGFTAYRFKG